MICKNCGSDNSFMTTTIMERGNEVVMLKCKNCGKIIQKD